MWYVRAELTGHSDVLNGTAASAAECAYPKRNRSLMESVLKNIQSCCPHSVLSW